MVVGQITFPEDKMIEEKLRIFHDYFHFICSDNCNRFEFRLENHLTILERALFRLDNIDNDADLKSTKTVLKNYFESELFNTSNDFFAKNGKIKTSINEIKKLLDNDSNRELKEELKKVFQTLTESFNLTNQRDKNRKKVKDNILIERIIFFAKNINDERLKEKAFSLCKNFTLENIQKSNLISQINKINKSKIKNREVIKALLESKGKLYEIEQEKNFYIFDCVYRLAHILFCDCDAATHEKEIIYLTKLIIAEFVRQGHFLKDLTDHTKGLFPQFFRRKGFIAQFETILAVLSKKQEGDFIIKIRNVKISDSNKNVNIFYQKNKIVSVEMLKEYEKYFLFEENALAKQEFEKFYQEEKCIFVIVPTVFKSFDIGLQNVLQKVTNIRNRLVYKATNNFGTQGNIDNFQAIFFNKNGGYRIQYPYVDFLYLNLHRLNNLSNLEDFKIGSFNPIFKRKIETCDNLFFKANTQFYWEDKIKDFWQYLEAIYSFYTFGKGYKIINSVSKILLIDEIKARKSKISSTIRNIFHKNNFIVNDSINNSKIAEINNIIKRNNSTENFNIDDFRTITAYPFVIKQLDNYQNVDNYVTKNQQKIKKYYSSIFWELYEQRNFVSHQGISCSSTLAKLVKVMPPLLRRFRWILIKELNEPTKQYQNMEELIESLESKI
ncbi:MAG: hypothetical protein ACPG5B_05160 [Chitinophagales bacterium]